MVMLGHGSVNVVRREPAAATAIPIRADSRVSLLRLVKRVVRLVLLGAADLVEDVGVDVRRCMYWLRLRRHSYSRLLLLLLQMMKLRGKVSY